MLSSEARNVSAYIFEKLGRNQVESLKMQKLMYFSKGWSWALQNKPLFDDNCEAWKHGPVISDLYEFHAGKIILPDDWNQIINGNPNSVQGTDQIVVDFVMQKYGAMTGWGLRNLTHAEGPWEDAWENSQNGLIKNYPISENEIRKYFRSQINI